MSLRNKDFRMVLAAGILLGAAGVLLAILGNPENSGICISCFMENAAGAIGLHDNPRLQYLRPELMGFVLGSLIASMVYREFSSRGGSAPLTRVAGGIFLMIGCGVFIGCPIKLFLRLTAGDLTAGAGVVGLVVGVWAGVSGIGKGVELPPPRQERGGSGFLIPAFFLLLLVFLLARPGFVNFSERGSAAEHATWPVSLGAGLVLGAVAQRSRFCITGSIRDIMLIGGRARNAAGVVAFLAAAFALNVASGRFHPGLYGQPGAHGENLWSFLGMALVGWTSVLIGGCPFRQMVKAGEGDADAGLVVTGMLIGGAVVQSWGIAATTAGVTVSGKSAVLVGLIYIAISSLFLRKRDA